MTMKLTSKVTIEITGEMIDGYAEIILGLMMISGILRKQVMTKRKNPDGSYTLIMRLVTTKPPLGSLGLGDIPDEK